MGVRDLEIARSVTLKPIQAIGETLGLAADDLEPYGRLKAKVRWEAVARLANRPDGALVLVTAMTPTPALPDSANWAACEMFSPRTNLSLTRS